MGLSHHENSSRERKPRQVFTYENLGNGSFTLTVLKAGKKDVFPKGSLTRYFTRQKDKEELSLLKGCTLEAS
jgi:hypothetical protein